MYRRAAGTVGRDLGQGNRHDRGHTFGNACDRCLPSAAGESPGLKSRCAVVAETAVPVPETGMARMQAGSDRGTGAIAAIPAGGRVREVPEEATADRIQHRLAERHDWTEGISRGYHVGLDQGRTHTINPARPAAAGGKDGTRRQESNAQRAPGTDRDALGCAAGGDGRACGATAWSRRAGMGGGERALSRFAVNDPRLGPHATRCHSLRAGCCHLPRGAAGPRGSRR